ncbi:hypothetical protein ACJX0J_011181, partial [Zea mays]
DATYTPFCYIVMLDLVLLFILSLITPVNPTSTWGPLIFIFALAFSSTCQGMLLAYRLRLVVLSRAERFSYRSAEWVISHVTNWNHVFYYLYQCEYYNMLMLILSLNGLNLQILNWLSHYPTDNSNIFAVIFVKQDELMPVCDNAGISASFLLLTDEQMN